MSNSPLTPADYKAAVVALAQADPAFRRLALDNPAAAFETAFKVPLPASFKLRVIEEGPDAYVVVLPHETRVGAGGELSDDDLESVAGGAAKSFKKLPDPFRGSGTEIGNGTYIPSLCK